jgi:hypothetical protein
LKTSTFIAIAFILDTITLTFVIYIDYIIKRLEIQWYTSLITSN